MDQMTKTTSRNNKSKDKQTTEEKLEIIKKLREMGGIDICVGDIRVIFPQVNSPMAATIPIDQAIDEPPKELTDEEIKQNEDADLFWSVNE
ncbi:MAG: hypothetical protein LLG04_07260 [Parachlamydia sp.]|nr:hypothetical protein [Parachlamydia sp.]